MLSHKTENAIANKHDEDWDEGIVKDEIASGIERCEKGDNLIFYAQQT